MISARKKTLLTILEKEIKKAQSVAEEKRETAKTFRAASRSQQGDRRMFETTANIVENRLSDLREFHNQVDLASTETAQRVKPICFVTIEFENGQANGFYFVAKKIQIPEVQLLSIESPLGQAILDKKAGQKFSYQVKNDGQTSTFSGQVITIE